RALSCPTFYCWSDSSLSDDTKRYVREHDLPEYRYEEAGHWPMVEAPLAIAAVIDDFFRAKLGVAG
ncbi:MAG TPA: alpha/beta hydrolase, partial [Polyangiaceae bacterium]|nr:alpha/beta hydrolase [Polyangiaceae bacterium]